jgi:chromosome segregation ATPase
MSLIERLRNLTHGLRHNDGYGLIGEAADEIERLTAERDAAIEGAAQEARYNNALRAEIIKNGEHLRYVEGQETMRCAEVRGLTAERDALKHNAAKFEARYERVLDQNSDLKGERDKFKDLIFKLQEWRADELAERDTLEDSFAVALLRIKELEKDAEQLRQALKIVNDGCEDQRVAMVALAKDAAREIQADLLRIVCAEIEQRSET